MKFTPKTQEQIDTENLLPEGAYDAEITSAEEKTSKKGNPMIEVNLKVYGANGGFRIVRDWLMEAVPHKLLHCAESLNLRAEYDAGEITSVLLQGKSTAVLIGQNAAIGDFRASNKVIDYLTATQLADHRSRPPKATKPSVTSAGNSLPTSEDDDIPF